MNSSILFHRWLGVSALLLGLASLAVPLASGEVLLPEAEAWLAAQPRDGYDVEALAAQLTTPDAAFVFVRDQIAPEPYAGVMKGAAGALLTHGANDCDRALLLARLLAAQGLEVKLVRGSLPAGVASALLAEVVNGPDAVERLIASLPVLAPQTEAPTFEQKAQRQLFRQQVADRSRVLSMVAQSQRSLVAAAQPATPHAKLPVASDHVWVQAVLDGKTIDFDPSRPTAKIGDTLTTVADSWAVDGLPDGLFHTFTLRLVAETLKDGQLERKELVTHNFRAADQLNRSLRVAIMPKTVPASALGDYRPLLLAGDDVFEGEAFRLSGAPVAPAEAPGMGGMFGGLGGDAPAEPAAAAPDDPNGPKLARLSVEIVFHTPGLPDENIRRVFLDRVEPADKGWRLVAALTEEHTVRPLIVQTWDAALDVGVPHPLSFMAAQLAALKTLDPLREALASGHQLEAQEVPAPVPAPQLIGFFLASGLKHHQLGRQTESIGRSFHLRPRVAFLRHGFAIRDWTNPAAGTPRFEEGIDLVNAPFAFTGAPEAAAQLARSAGLADTALEQYVLNHQTAFNIFPLLAAAQDQHISLLTLTKPAQLAQLDVAPAIRAILTEELIHGRVLVAPAHAVALGGTHAFGWWSIDPVTGYPIGKMELGGAQGLTEASQINQKITEWTENYVKFLGNVLKCYNGALEDALGSVKPDYANLTVNVTVNHGDGSPLPGTDALIKCLRDTACDALKDFITSELNSAAVFDEEKAIDAMIGRWAEQKAIGQAGDSGSQICQKALGGGGK